MLKYKLGDKFAGIHNNNSGCSTDAADGDAVVPGVTAVVGPSGTSIAGVEGDDEMNKSVGSGLSQLQINSIASDNNNNNNNNSSNNNNSATATTPSRAHKYHLSRNNNVLSSATLNLTTLHNDNIGSQFDVYTGGME